MFSLFTYTHTNCTDVWPAYYDRLNKYFGNIPSYSMVNTHVTLPHNNIVFEYDDNKSYTEEFVRCLNRLPFDFFIYMQEDFILYDFPKLNEIQKCIDFLNNTNFSFVRLIKCGSVTETPVTNNLFLISKDEKSHFSYNCYSMQPTIWKKKDFISLYLKCGNSRFGEGIEYSNAMNILGMNGVYYFNDDPKRISSDHYDSSIFPYIATAVVKGKWNYNQYVNELQSVFTEYGIDMNKRGFI